MASGGGGGVVPAFALGLSTTGLLEPTRVSGGGGGGEEHQVCPGSKAPKGEVRSVCAYRVHVLQQVDSTREIEVFDDMPF